MALFNFNGGCATVMNQMLLTISDVSEATGWVTVATNGTTQRSGRSNCACVLQQTARQRIIYVGVTVSGNC